MGNKALIDRVMDLEYEIVRLRKIIEPEPIVAVKRAKPERVHVDFEPKGNWKKRKKK